MNEQVPSKERGCYVMDGVMYTSHADGSETSRKATDEEVLLADALLRTSDELRGCSRELAIERRAAQRAADEPRVCCHDAPEGMHHPRCLNVGSPATRAAQPPVDVRFERGCYVLMEMMQAYERRIRSDCTTPEQIAKRPWECSEYVAAADYLNKVWPPYSAATKEGEQP